MGEEVRYVEDGDESMTAEVLQDTYDNDDVMLLPQDGQQVYVELSMLAQMQVKSQKRTKSQKSSSDSVSSADSDTSDGGNYKNEDNEQEKTSDDDWKTYKYFSNS